MECRWVLELDESGAYTYSTAPHWILDPLVGGGHGGVWVDHWKQCVCFLGGKGEVVEEGGSIGILAVHDDVSIGYCVEEAGEGVRQVVPQVSATETLWSPERCLELGGGPRRNKLRRALERVVQHLNLNQ